MRGYLKQSLLKSVGYIQVSLRRGFHIQQFRLWFPLRLDICQMSVEELTTGRGY